MSRVAVVTGGTRGIGRAISEALQAAGMTVAANYAWNDDRAQEFSERTGIPSFKWDVADAEACLSGCALVEEQLGPIDILINNAGVTRDGTLMKMTSDMWKHVIDTNLGGCFNMAKAVYPGMRSRKWGRIVSISSINGQAGQIGQVNYAAAKSGIFGFTKALALEGARDGIAVNAVAPGYINTEMVAAVPAPAMEKILSKVPAGRLGEPDEVARTVVFLCDEGAGFVTGSTVTVNGGLYMH